MKFLKGLWTDNTNEKHLQEAQKTVEKINNLEENTRKLSLEELSNKTDYFKKKISSGVSLDDILPEAFATVRETAQRVLEQRHFDVQLMGGIMLHHGKITEMKTGEGKTLVATLPVYLNALSGRGVHVVTVNDYLARRDVVWMGQIYASLGMSVGVINHDSSYLYDFGHTEVDKERDEEGSFKIKYEFLRPCTRKEAYSADITYGTNNEYGFDYLRDNTEYAKDELRQRDFNFAIIDEVDSILIDEARTPLIISAPSTESGDLYTTFATIVKNLKKEEDYELDEKLRSATLTDSGIEKTEKILGIENIYTEKGIKYVHHLETAVRAKALFTKDKDYVIKDGEVVIIDEFTGRLQSGRRYSEGLHQALEAKEGVLVQRESRTVASITFQNYFRLYKKLSGMTGTAVTSKEEFLKVYNIEVIEVPTNKPIVRLDKDDLIFQTEQGKLKAVSRKIKELNEKGQPVLVGTVSVEKNELLSAYLKGEGVAHEILNAKNHEREGEIIAAAGKLGGVTIATNLAGRGVDIKLGGTLATQEESEKIKKIGGLFVLGTERHEARRIDNQLRGRAGRQGDPGETQFFVSLEDDLMRIFASDTIKKMMGRIGIAEDEPIENGMITRSLESAQTKIEGFHFDARKRVLEFDDVMNHQRKTVYERRRKIITGNIEEIKTELESVVLGDESIEKNISDKVTSLGVQEFYEAVRRLILQSIDMFWLEHLEVMEYTRSSVNLRAYGQRDPLVEYKKEGLRLFKEMQKITNEQILSAIPNIGVGAFAAEEKKLEEAHKQVRIVSGSDGQANKDASKSEFANVGRNDPCPCGSGKKFKRCHGA